MEERGEVFSAQSEPITLCEFGLNLCTVQDFQALLGGAFVIVAAGITAAAVLWANHRSVRAMRDLAEATRDMAQASLEGIEKQERLRRDHEHKKRSAERYQEAFQLAGSLIGEIKAVLGVVLVRRIKEHYSEELRRAKIPGEDFCLPRFSTKGGFFNVYLGNTQNLGMFDPPLPERLVEFYTRAIAFIDFNQSVYDGDYDNENRRRKQEVLKELRGDLTYLESLGRKLQEDLCDHREKMQNYLEQFPSMLRDFEDY